MYIFRRCTGLFVCTVGPVVVPQANKVNPWNVIGHFFKKILQTFRQTDVLVEHRCPRISWVQ